MRFPEPSSVRTKKEHPQPQRRTPRESRKGTPSNAPEHRAPPASSGATPFPRACCDRHLSWTATAPPLRESQRKTSWPFPVSSEEMKFSDALKSFSNFRHSARAFSFTQETGGTRRQCRCNSNSRRETLKPSLCRFPIRDSCDDATRGVDGKHERSLPC